MIDLTERRIMAAAELRVDAEDDGTKKIKGYAAVFGKRSVDLGGFVEIIKPGAFKNVLKGKPDVRALVNHDPSMVLGRTTAGTLRLSEDDKGLAVEIDPPDTQIARDLMASIGRGDVDQMSFAFRVGEERWTYPEADDDAPVLREIREVSELMDVSAVTYPAYPDTTVAVRSRDAGRPAATPLPTPNLDHARLRLAEAELSA